MSPPLCLFHRADLDGVCSAAIVKKFVPDCELHGIDYGDEFPWAKVMPAMINEVLPARYKFNGKTVVDAASGSVSYAGKRQVYLLDFSLPPEDMKKLAESCDLVWIDHHKSAILSMPEDLKVSGLCIHTVAACELCWRWFTEEPGSPGYGTPLPEAVRLLGRYDVWDKDNPDWPRIEAFQFGMRAFSDAMYPLSKVWHNALHDGYEHWIDQIEGVGSAVLSYRDQEAKSLCADGAHVLWITDGKGFVREISGKPRTVAFRVLALNTMQRGSWLFNGVWDPEKHDATCVYGQLKDGRWRVSLYSTKPEVDCGAIAKSLGGGGHRGAAGFICDELPWRSA